MSGIPTNPEAEEHPDQCGTMATFKYTWPGKDEAVVCAICATKLATVANAIGMHLQLILIDPKDWPEEGPPSCPQKMR